jgi:hypothetical protein
LQCYLAQLVNQHPGEVYVCTNTIQCQHGTSLGDEWNEAVAPLPLLYECNLLFCSLRSNKSGHLSFLFVVLPLPSVILSPTTKKLFWRGATHASILLRKYQCAVDCVAVSFTASAGAATALPNWNQLVVRLPGCDVMLFVVWPAARYIVIVTICWALMGKAMGSETARAPLGMLIEDLPEKVTVWRVEGWIWCIPARWLMGSATVTAVIGNTLPPNAFENLSRIWLACAVMKSVWRIVEFTKTAPVWFCSRINTHPQHLFHHPTHHHYYTFPSQVQV